ncbi:unnamed protein product, partial [Prorocentrum cordatum]
MCAPDGVEGSPRVAETQRRRAPTWSQHSSAPRPRRCSAPSRGVAETQRRCGALLRPPICSDPARDPEARRCEEVATSRHITPGAPGPIFFCVVFRGGSIGEGPWGPSLGDTALCEEIAAPGSQGRPPAGRPLRRPPPWAGRGPAAERLPPGRGQPALCGRARGPAARADAVRGRGPRRPRHHLPHPARGACPPGRRRGVHHRRRVPEPGPQRARGARLGAHRLRLRGRRLRPGPRAGRGGVRRGPRGPRRPVLARLARRARRLRRDVRPARGARGRGHAPRKRPLASCRSAGSRGPSGGRGTPTSPGPTRRRPRRGSARCARRCGRRWASAAAR